MGIFGFDYLLLPLQDTMPVRALRDMSKNINTVYCIQWTFIGVVGILLSGVLFPKDGLTFVPMTFLAAVVLIISGIVAHWYQKRKFLRTKPGKIALVSILIIVTVIRWSDRHYGFEAGTRFEKEIDMEAPDEWMESHFMDWHFLE